MMMAAVCSGMLLLRHGGVVRIHRRVVIARHHLSRVKRVQLRLVRRQRWRRRRRRVVHHRRLWRRWEMVMRMVMRWGGGIGCRCGGVIDHVLRHRGGGPMMCQRLVLLVMGRRMLHRVADGPRRR